MMLVIIDSEGTPVQEFSALYVNEETQVIQDVFHAFAKYPSSVDADWFARRYVHGLDRKFLREFGLRDEEEVLKLFHTWLQTHPFDDMYANAPAKEEDFLSQHVRDVCLRPWKDRVHCKSHQIALDMKLNCVPVCGVTCCAHSRFRGWKPKRLYNMTSTDVAKHDFQHHCSLYDCIEIFHFLSLQE